MDEILVPRRDDEVERDLIAVHIPTWVRDLVKNGDQVTAVFDDESRCRWLVNGGEVTPADTEVAK